MLSSEIKSFRVFGDRGSAGIKSERASSLTTSGEPPIASATSLGENSSASSSSLVTDPERSPRSRCARSERCNFRSFRLCAKALHGIFGGRGSAGMKEARGVVAHARSVAILEAFASAAKHSTKFSVAEVRLASGEPPIALALDENHSRSFRLHDGRFFTAVKRFSLRAFEQHSPPRLAERC